MGVCGTRVCVNVCGSVHVSMQNQWKDVMFFPLKSIGLLKIQLIPMTKISLAREGSVLQLRVMVVMISVLFKTTGL